MNILESARELVYKTNRTEARRLDFRHREIAQWPPWAQEQFRVTCEAMVAIRQQAKEDMESALKLSRKADGDVWVHMAPKMIGPGVFFSLNLGNYETFRPIGQRAILAILNGQEGDKKPDRAYEGIELPERRHDIGYRH